MTLILDSYHFVFEENIANIVLLMFQISLTGVFNITWKNCKAVKQGQLVASTTRVAWIVTIRHETSYQIHIIFFSSCFLQIKLQPSPFQTLLSTLLQQYNIFLLSNFRTALTVRDKNEAWIVTIRDIYYLIYFFGKKNCTSVNMYKLLLTVTPF